jgi:ankyrin repeat protein
MTENKLKNIVSCCAFFLISLFVLNLISCAKKEKTVEETGKKKMIYSADSFFKEVKTGNREGAGALIKEGIDVNVKDKEGSSALLIATEKRDYNMVKLLLEKGADVNARDIDGYTALMYVAYNGNLEIAKLLLEHGADVNARDKDKWTALMIAGIQKKADIVELLRKHGAGK